MKAFGPTVLNGGIMIKREDRAALRRLLDSEDWKPVQSMLDAWKIEKLQACGTAQTNHAFWQGYWRAIVQFEADLRAACLEPEETKPQTPESFERARGMRNTDGAPY